MKPGRVVALVAGILLILPSLGVLLGGVSLAVAYGIGRDDDGFVSVDIDRLETDTVAITAGEADFDADPGTPDWFWSALDTDLRIRVDGASAGDGEIFVGIGPSSDVARYLADVAHDELVDLDGDPEYRLLPGADDVAPPGEQTFWEVSSAGTTEQEVRWDVRGGSWTAVLMNADGSAGLAADVNVGLRSGAVVPIALAMVFFGGLFTAAAVLLIVYGAAGARTDRPTGGAPAATPAAESGDPAVSREDSTPPSV